MVDEKTAEEEDVVKPGDRKALRERLAHIPTNEELKLLVEEMHAQSRTLRALPPSRLWPTHYTRAWQDACKEFTPHLKAAMDSGSELALLQGAMDFMELPCRVLLPLVEEDKKKQATRTEDGSTQEAHRRSSQGPGLDRTSQAPPLQGCRQRPHMCRRLWLGNRLPLSSPKHTLPPTDRPPGRADCLRRHT